jgi:hypothetical protein
VSYRSSQKDAKVDIRISSEQLLAIDAQAFMSGVSRSDFMRCMINKSWANRLAKPHRPYVSIVSLLIDISTKLTDLYSRETISNYDQEGLENTQKKLNTVLDQIIERMALDQEGLLSDNNEETAFE